MTTHPQTLALAVELIEQFEGVEEEAYLDPIGVPTICAGLTYYPDGTPVRMGDICDSRICRGHLDALLAREYVQALSVIPGWARLGPKRQAVLLSFAWNLGSKFYGSAGFETITRVLKNGAQKPEVYDEMPKALALYNKGGGKALPGLTIRRRKEGEIWQQESDGVIELVCQLDTWLKKSPIVSSELSADGKKASKKGDVLRVSRLDEIPRDSHSWATLAGSGERWAIYGPHWLRKGAAAAVVPQKVNWSDFNSRAGEFITVGDVLQFDARRRPKPGSADEKALLEICKQFDAMRRAWNGPIGVTSGYRPEPINRQVGGVQGSYHVKGMALDVYPIGESLGKFHQWLLQRWSGGYGDGRGKGFIHIDTRNGGRFEARAGVRPVAIWTY